MVGLVEPGRPDMDAASSCSGDLSNPDSGKGASEEGDNAHCLPAEPGKYFLSNDIIYS